MLNSVTLLHRELLVGARKRSTYWGRLVMAGGSTLLGSLLLWSMSEGAFAGGATPGLYLFYVVAWIGLGVTGLFGVFFAADAVSSERREGTLGLLFLTRLRARDVVLGKLSATALRSGFSLLAALPIIALPMLMGGVTFKSYGLTALVLGNTLFLSVAVGLAVSAFNRQPVRAVMTTLLVVLALAGLTVWVDAAIADYEDRNFRPYASYLSPGYANYLAVNTRGAGIGWCLGAQHLAGWVLLLIATVGTGRVKESVRAAPRRPFFRWLLGVGDTPRAKSLRGRSPVQWLTQRRGRAPTIIAFTLLILAGLWAAWSSTDINQVYWQVMLSSGLSMFCYPFHFILIIWLAAEVARRTGDARREGALELMLATSLTVPEIVSGFWRGLIRMFGPALLVILLFRCVTAGLNLWAGYEQALQAQHQTANNQPVFAYHWSFFYQQLVATGFGLINIFTLAAAVAWVGLWLGLIMERPTAATALTWVLVAVGPYIVLFVVQILLMTTMAVAFGGNMQLMWLSALIQGSCNLLLQIVLIFWARRGLRRHFREATNGTYRRRRLNLSKFRRQPPPLPA